jgi:hypothetical protein
VSNHPQGPSATPVVGQPEQCPGCPLGNSLPLVAGESACGIHVWWAADNGAALNLVYDD